MTLLLPILGILAGLALLGGAALHGLRNRLLAARLPKIRETLRERLPGAEVAGLELDGSWRLLVSGARIPLGGGFVLEARSGRISGVPAFIRSRNLEALVVEVVEGVLAIGSPSEGRSLSAPVTFEGRGPLLQGTLRARGAAWTHRGRELGTPPPFDLEARLEVTPTSWSISDARATAAGATLAWQLTGKIGPGAPGIRVSGRIEGAGAPLVAHVLAACGMDPVWPPDAPEHAGPGPRLPRDLKVSGDLALEPDLSGRADLVLETATSRLPLEARVDASGAFTSSRLGGKLSFADALACRFFTSTIRPLPKGEVDVDARLEGSLARPSLGGRLYARTVELGADPEVGVPVLPFTDASVTMRIDPTRLTWQELVATGFGGHFSGSGSLELAETPSAHATQLSWQGVRLEQIPTSPAGARDLERLLKGSAWGELSFRGKGGETALIAGEGTLTISEPEYLFLRDAEETLGSYGLPPLPVTGSGPLRARLVLADDRIEARGIDGRVPGLRFEGTAGTSWAGALAGRIEAHLEQAYVARSLLLALPAAFGGAVTVPLEIGGVMGRPEIKADAVATIGSFLKKNPMRDVVNGVMDGLWRVFDGRGPIKAGPDLDRVFERILEGGSEGDELLERLIETGISVEDVQDLLADFRRRRC